MSKHEEIAGVLTEEILVGQYRVGERLPSERDLALRFDANRGAVREAMKKLEQLGIADIQPGGARVAPINQASLDVIGALLALDEVPSRQLADQIMVVIGALVETAAVAAVERLSDTELDALREIMQRIWSEDLDEEAHIAARTEIFGAIMAASGNLPVQIIAKSLLEQFSPRMAPLHGYMDRDRDNHRSLARRLDDALATRDPVIIRAQYRELSSFHREQVNKAFDAYEAAQQQPVNLEVVAS